jgi:hypothetical protein
MKTARSLRLSALLAALVLSSLPARADVHDITTGWPTVTGNVVIDIIDRATNFLIKTTTAIPAGITPVAKATLIEADIVAGINAAPPPFNNQFTCTRNGSILTVRNKANGGSIVKVIFDGTREGNALRVYPDSAPWWVRLLRWLRIYSVSSASTVVPASVTATVSFDSPNGYQSRTIAGDGVKTVGQLEDELTSSLASAGFTFTTTLVHDPVDGDRYELESQQIPTSSAAWTFTSFQIQTSPQWSDFMGTMGIETDVAPIGALYCFGDGSTPTPCPCGNFGLQGHGCNNSANTGGSRLEAFGATNPDSVVLVASGELQSPLSIFLQGNANLAQGATFGDGVRCAGGNLKRLYVHNAMGGQVSAPYWDEPTITQRSAALGDPIVQGSTRFYQVYYRDPQPTFCPTPLGNSWNVSNGVQISLL